MESKELRELHAALPIPRRADLGVGIDLFAEDLRRTAKLGARGLYTTGSTGEFYVLDFDEFRRMAWGRRSSRSGSRSERRPPLELARTRVRRSRR